MANYDVTTQIFGYMDEVSKEFVAANLGVIIATITPVVAIALTIHLMVEGLFTMVRGTGVPLTDLVGRFIRYGIICSIATAGGWYQTDLAAVALNTPDEFAQILIIDGRGAESEGQMASTIDKALDDGLTTAKKAFDNAGVTSGAGLASFLLAAGVLISTIMICGIGAALIILAKFVLAIAVCFGPIFIFCLLFKSTQMLFSKWIGSIINYGLLTILLAAVFGLMMKFYGRSIEAAASPNPDTPILVPIVTCGLLTVVSWFVLKKIPDLASSWGSGVSAAYQMGRSTWGSASAGNASAASSKGGAAGGGAGAAGAVGKGVGGAGGAAGGGAAAGAAGGVAGVAASAVGAGMQGMSRGSRRAG